LQVPVGDNYFAALNSAVFSDGSFVYVPKGVKSPMELSTYFRINASETGQVRDCAALRCAVLCKWEMCQCSR
jgi:Fe-S cluster assembly scaffold protein SufB